MGSAFARGLAACKAVNPSDITISTPHPAKDPSLGGCRFNLTSDNTGAAKGADVIVIAVKPWVLPGVIGEIASAIGPETEVCAIVAGVSAADLRAMFPGQVPSALSIAMPNTAMAVSESMTFVVDVCGHTPQVESLFSHLGRVMVTEERLLPGATALASCGIAYAMRYARAATEGGVELGFKAKDALAIVSQTLRGTVSLLDVDGAHPETEIDKVTTPGGLTIRGLNAMERAGFTAAVIEGLKASVR